STPGNDMNLDPRRLEGARNFANKIWNAARFIITNLPTYQSTNLPGDIGKLVNWELGIEHWELVDRWIVSRLNRLIGEVTTLFDSYQYGEAGRRINDFLWSEFCDWYIEACKIRLYGEDAAAQATAWRTLAAVLEQALRLLHPFMPFVTEEIWQHLKAAAGGDGWGEALMLAPWPQADEALLDAQAEADMDLLMDLIRQIRNARAEFDVTPGKRVPAIIVGGAKLGMLASQRNLLTFLARVDDARLTLTETLDEKPKQAVALVAAEGVEAYLPLAGLVNLEQEIARLQKAIADAERQIAHAERMLSNEQFVAKAPERVVQQQRDRLAEQKERRARLQARLQALQG
ncbi:MAG TPA: valine--tRNA ligase, partial [Anaerolineae bacterium]|nr:valine--tRNA ligase [Anaerolineae bacterium]